jgi:iron complex outermembrane receptor protein
MAIRSQSRKLALRSGGSLIALLALASADAAFAQATTAATPTQSDDSARPTTPGTVKEVVITGRRKALEDATLRKKNSDTVIDSVVADEAGKLPDTSVTEVLQRVTGVTISRFASLGSPDQFSFEGSGIQVRGLSGVTGLLNGREIFSANGGSGLNWGDVTPELMAAVDVYKASTSDIIEGGTGGAIDLRTRMPFDYKKPEIDVSASLSYGDFAKQGTPSGSILMTDRWQTPVGEFGALVDVSYAQFKYADSFIRTEPYYQTTYNGQPVYVPGGFDWGNDEFNRVRKGLYFAFQWRPTDTLTLWQTDFVSNYHQTNGGGGVFAVDDASDVVVNGVFNKQGIFQSGTIQAQGSTPGNPNGIYPGNANSFNPSDNTTADFSQGFIWRPIEHLNVAGALQIVESGAYAGDFDMGVGSGAVYGESLNLTGSGLPHDSFVNPGAITDPTQATVNDIVWNHQKNNAEMKAANLDAQYNLGDGFFKSVKVGGRYAQRWESDTFTGTWWSPTGRGWNGVPQSTVSNSPASDFELYSFPDFFKGGIASPSPYYMFNPSKLVASDFGYLVNTYAACYPGGHFSCTPAYYIYGNPPDINLGNAPNDSKTKTSTTDFYAKLNFGTDRLGWLPPFTGNLGMRLVHDTVTSAGSFSFAGGQSYYLTLADATTSLADVGGLGGLAAWQTAHPNTPLPLSYTTVATSGTREESFQYTRALPSLNVAFKPDSKWVIRVAVNQTLSPPNYNDIRSTGSGGVNTTANPYSNNLPGIFTGYSYSSGDTKLKPAVSTNEDVSIEWYPKSSTTAHFDVFNKDIKDMIIYNDFSEGVAQAFGTISPESMFAGGGNSVVPGATSNKVDINAGKTSTILGFEIGGRTYFDMLPGALKGFGVESNFTYIDSHSPSNLAFDMNGASESKVPIVGLSNYNFNINLLYDLGKWDARLAYSFRSKYLATTTGNGTTGSYQINGMGSPVSYSLPVYGAAIGTLDGSISYKFTPHLQLAIDGANLLNNVSKTTMEIFQGDFVTRSWFMNDRRVSAAIRASF